MNEAETRAELIDPKLQAAGWGVLEGTKIRREYHITAGRIQAGGRGKPTIADYILVYKNRPLAVVEAKSNEYGVGEGVGQAKEYAQKLNIRYTYATNGKEIYEIDMQGGEGKVSAFPTPEVLWQRTFNVHNEWQERFIPVPFEDISGTKPPRYYQEIAVDKALEAISQNKNRILLTLATGTGKTTIAFHIVWKLFATRWNAKRDASRRPRVLFLADRNILADQAFSEFTRYNAFPEDALVRIKPDGIRKNGRVPTNGSVFFTIFQTFMSGGSTSSPTAHAEPSHRHASGEPAEPSPTAHAEPSHRHASGEPAEPSPTAHESNELQEITIQSVKDAYGYMYILECADGSFYTGSTKDLRLRMEQHNNGEGAEYTKNNLPVKLVYYETFDRIDSAFNREKQIQKWSRAKKLALIQGDIEALKELSKNRQTSVESSNVPASVETPKVPEPVEGYFGEYPKDFFDFIIIDECHRGGANDESTWRSILEYFSPAVQLGLTATPKRDENVDTYKYFGEPVYIYSLKQGINDGFLTPFKVRRIQTTLDEYIYTSEDTVLEGDIEAGKVYKEADFNRIIEIEARERKRVELFMDELHQNEKALVFCATQDHAAATRNLINQTKSNPDPMYCVRVTANDGELGEQYLREFQDNERTIPTILTTSQKLSTGVDARNVRAIVLMRPVNSMIEFKQIIGRGTRLFDGKDYFTIYDFVGAYHHFADPEWDGEPEEPVIEDPKPKDQPKRKTSEPKPDDYEPRPKVKVKLRDGKERHITHMASTMFYDADGKPLTAEQFMEKLFGKLPDLFKTEEELRRVWSSPITRKALLEKLAEAGFGSEQLHIMQTIIDAEKSDLFDVLTYIAYASQPITREVRVAKAQSKIFAALTNEQKQFVEFVLTKYIETGVEELDQEKLPSLLQLKYQALEDARQILGEIQSIRELFVEFQKHLYVQQVKA
ncbi:MAG: DEAD/DEAH box helicase family protein [Anaerolineae bacterium]|nr:DEAD/DEAH box helicase family protein [Anaerolineae bacterium]